MKTIWTDGLNAEEKQRIKDDYASSASLRKRLTEMLTKMQDAERNASLSRNAYECTNWALMQADAVGFQRALKNVIDLLTT